MLIRMPSWAGACGTSAVAALPAPILLVAQANLRPANTYRTTLLIDGSLWGAKSHAACQRASIPPRRAWACWPVGARCGCAGPFARTFSFVAKAFKIQASNCGYVRNVTFVARPGNRWMPNVSRSLAGSGNGEPAEHREDSSHALHALHLDFFPLSTICAFAASCEPAVTGRSGAVADLREAGLTRERAPQLLNPNPVADAKHSEHGYRYASDCFYELAFRHFATTGSRSLLRPSSAAAPLPRPYPENLYQTTTPRFAMIGQLRP
jgi:hypothetical protein